MCYNSFGTKIYSSIHFTIMLKKLLNLLRMAGRFIDQRRKGQKRIISIAIANKEVAFMQMWVKSPHWLLLKGRQFQLNI